MEYGENDDAPDGVTKWPFYFSALFILALVLSFIEPSLSSLYLSYGREAFIAGFDLYFSSILILCCVALGIIGARLASSRELDNLDDIIA